MRLESRGRALMPVPVDVDAARRVLEQAAVQQRVPRPRLGEWWRDLLTRLAEVIAGIFDLSSATVRTLLTFASWGLIGLAALVLLGWTVSVLWRRRGAGDEAADRGETTAVALERDHAVDWERRLREALDRSDVSAALRAQWQVLITRLRLDGAPETRPGVWTTRAVLRGLGSTSRVASSALGSAMGRLERWTYGGRPPAIEDLRGLRADFDAALAPSERDR